MKTVYDEATRDGLIARINTLKEDGTALWGKMNVTQMMGHMIVWNEWVLGKNDLPHKQGILGKLIGRWMLKKDTKDDTPMSKGMPAGKGFIVNEPKRNFTAQKGLWIDLLREYESYGKPYFLHDFYGKMTKEQLGIFAYKHTDHHLRQFGV